MASPRHSHRLQVVLGILIATGFGIFFVLMRNPAPFQGALPPTQTTRPASIMMSTAEFTTIPTGSGTRVYIAGFDRDRPASQRNINGIMQTEDIMTGNALPAGATLTRCNYIGYFGSTPVTVDMYCLQWTPSSADIGTHPIALRVRDYDTGTFSTDVSTLTLIVNNTSSSSSSRSSGGSSSSSSSVQPFVSITSPLPNTVIGPVGIHTRIPITITYITNQNAEQKTVVGIDNALSGTLLNQQNGSVTFDGIGSGTHLIKAYVIVRATGQTIAGTLVQFPLTISVDQVSSSSSSAPSCGNGITETHLGEQCDRGKTCTPYGNACTSNAGCGANETCQTYDQYGCFSTCLWMIPPDWQ